MAPKGKQEALKSEISQTSIYTLENVTLLSRVQLFIEFNLLSVTYKAMITFLSLRWSAVKIYSQVGERFMIYNCWFSPKSACAIEKWRLARARSMFKVINVARRFLMKILWTVMMWTSRSLSLGLLMSKLFFLFPSKLRKQAKKKIILRRVGCFCESTISQWFVRLKWEVWRSFVTCSIFLSSEFFYCFECGNTETRWWFKIFIISIVSADKAHESAKNIDVYDYFNTFV